MAVGAHAEPHEVGRPRQVLEPGVGRGVSIVRAEVGDIAASWPEASLLVPPGFGAEPYRRCALAVTLELEPGERPPRLAELVAVEPDSDTLELMWGSPGLLLIADAMLERTGEQRWASAWSAIAERLMAKQGANGLWTQRLYGSTTEYLGPAHGFAGIVAALARRPDEVPVERLAAALEATALREGNMANWPPSHQEPLAKQDGSIRTQWCHGAPGIVTSIAALPGTDELLRAGGELTWAAGPLKKGAGLCHGTAGNGFALLKLFTRTGDEEWLQRARRFAMHSAAQVARARGRHTLWTGDLGTAMYLHQCLAGTSDMPTIDAW